MSPINKPAISNEERLEDLLEELKHPELIAKQRQNFATSEDKEATLRDIENIVKERNEALKENFPDLHLDASLDQDMSDRHKYCRARGHESFIV